MCLQEQRGEGGVAWHGVWEGQKSIRMGQRTGKTSVGMSQLEGMEVLPVLAQ